MASVDQRAKGSNRLVLLRRKRRLARQGAQAPDDISGHRELNLDVLRQTGCDKEEILVQNVARRCYGDFWPLRYPSVD